MLQFRLREPIFTEPAPTKALVRVGNASVGEAPTGIAGVAIMLGGLALLSVLAWMALRKAT